MKKFPFHENIPFKQNELSVKIETYTTDESFKPHWHEHIELLYILEGEGSATCNENTFPVKKGDLIVVNSTQIHTLTPKGTLTFCCVLFYSWFFSDVEFDVTTIISPCVREDSFVKESIGKMIAQKETKTHYRDMLIKSYAYEIMAYLLKNYTEHQMTKKDTLLHTSRLKTAETVLYYINEHYCEKITSGSLADLCCMNESYFCRFFKRNFNKTPIEYLNEFRIEKACELLNLTTRTITDIALSVGFEDINYFSRMFKKIKNCSPSEYRGRVCS